MLHNIYFYIFDNILYLLFVSMYYVFMYLHVYLYNIYLINYINKYY